MFPIPFRRGAIQPDGSEDPIPPTGSEIIGSEEPSGSEIPAGSEDPDPPDPNDLLVFERTEDGTGYCVVGVGLYTGTTLDIPAMHNQRPVVAIGDAAFRDQIRFTSVTIPYTVTDIGDYAFQNCTALEQIRIYGTLSHIGRSAFDKTAYAVNEYNLDGGSLYLDKYLLQTDKTMKGEYTVAEDTLLVADYAFYQSKLDTVILPDSVLHVGGNAFSSSEVSIVYLGNRIQTLGESAFSVCTKLASVYLPASLTSIGTQCFFNCPSLVEITVENGNAVYQSIGNCLLERQSGKLIVGCQTSVIPEKEVRVIGKGAFYGCTGLTSITIPDSVLEIEERAFYGCKGLTSVHLGSGIVYAGESAFYACDLLESVSISDLSAFCRIDFQKMKNATVFQFQYSSNPLSNGASLYLNGEPIRVLHIPSDVTVLSPYLFYRCKGLEEAVIGKQVTAAYGSVFRECPDLVSVRIDVEWKSLPTYFFQGCANLQSVILSDHFNTVEQMAFQNCTSLEEIRFPKYLTTLDRGAFSGCTSLKKIEFSEYLRIIDEMAFQNCKALTELIFPADLQQIGYAAFGGCTGILRVELPEGIKTIDISAFANCNQLTEIRIPESVNYVGDSAFAYAYSLKTIYCGDRLYRADWATDWKKDCEWAEVIWENEYEIEE